MKRKRTTKKQQQESTPHSRKQKQMHRSHECTLVRGLKQRRKREKSSIPFRLKRGVVFLCLLPSFFATNQAEQGTRLAMFCLESVCSTGCVGCLPSASAPSVADGVVHSLPFQMLFGRALYYLLLFWFLARTMFIAGLLIMIRPVIRKLPYNRIEALLFAAGADFPPFVFTITPFIAQQVVCVCIDGSQPRGGWWKISKTTRKVSQTDRCFECNCVRTVFYSSLALLTLARGK